MTLFAPKTPLADLAAMLDTGAATSRELTETALERIAADGGNGGAAFCFVDADSARRQADALDALRRAGTRLSPLAGVPISVKDLFDVQGQPTRAGSRVLADAPPASTDAPAVARLRRAGAVLIGRTNMSEFAFSGLGLNPHYGSPASPWRRSERHVAGGSSSGAAASVADGLAAAGLGSDTGGSLRIPAAFCGLTGFKPSAGRVSTEGVVPLSPTLDVVGAIAPSVACCAMVDGVLSGTSFAARRPLAGARLGVLRNYVMDGIEPDVARTYEAALDKLAKAGALLTEVRFAPLDALPSINTFGFSPIEAFAAHRSRLDTQAHAFDGRVLARIRRGESASAADYLDLLAARRATIAAAQQFFAGFDAFVMPTVPVAPPLIAALEADDAAFAAANALVLRNPSIVNFLDGCAVSLPCHREGDAPVGLSVCGFHGQDGLILALAGAAETVFKV
ncbi:amidase [Caballeronia sp. SEWSISQ10-4 2]|uniref:amidase n=1 Tax=Caballeronia sp. SEWSISQ10-4 2 TaxID=2937438 RepID=UPI00264C01BE|nr:amidase [Caballeronia sp. SEWSISQ10-4 2]MDN7183522.1 amidase [Caballeronia sp. SEWSISQ10-4 2]